MRIHAISYYSESDPEMGLQEMYDIEYFCSNHCMNTALGEIGEIYAFRGGELDKPADEVEFKDEPGGVSYGGWPGGSETDSDTHCATCEELLWEGLESAD